MVRYLARAAAPLLSGALILACAETVTEVSTSRFEVTLRARGSFVEQNPPRYLVGDVVTFEAEVTENGEPFQASGARYRSSAPDTVEILDPSTGQAAFHMEGPARITVVFAQPEFAGADSLLAYVDVTVDDFDVTFSLESTLMGGSVTPDDALLGDIVRIMPTVTLDGEEVQWSGLMIESAEPAGRVDLSAGGDDAAALIDSGPVTLHVALDEPDIPGNEPLRASLDVMITERFYGTFSKTSGDFGALAPPSGDPVTVDASAFHRFTDTTRIEFPRGAVAFIDALTPTQLTFLVPAAADTGRLVFRNLVDVNGGLRDSVLTLIEFNGPGTAVVDDYYEPNDMFPLTAEVNITPPPLEPLNFEALLSYDPGKSAPADTNFFYLTVPPPPASPWRLDVVAEWQIDADIDFKVCNATGTGDPPQSYDPAFCSVNNTMDPRQEAATGLGGLTLSAGRYIIGFYCKLDACPTDIPLTYRVTIAQQ